MNANTNDDANGSDGPFADSLFVASTDKPHRRHGGQSPDTRPEIYVSTDIEADGPTLSPYSVLSFASVAYLVDKTLVGMSEINLETLAGAEDHPTQIQWWKTQPGVWAAYRVNPETSEVALSRYARWVESLPGESVFVAFPAGFDSVLMFWYMMRLAGRSPFGWATPNIRTLAFTLIDMPYRCSVRAAFPEY